MEERRSRLAALMEEAGMTTESLAGYVNDSPAVPYRVTSEEVKSAMDGTGTTPKSRRIVADGIAHIERVLRRLDCLSSGGMRHGC